MTGPAGRERGADGLDGASTTRVLYVQAPGYPRTGLGDRLRAAGFDTTMTADAADALRHLAAQAFAVGLVDLAGGRGTLTAVRLLRARHAALPIAGVVDPAAPAVAAEAIHAGLSDLLTWPFDAIDLAAVLADIRDRAPSGSVLDPAGAIVAFSPAMRQLLRDVRDVAGTRQTVCVAGAHGTGTSLVARAVHQASAGATAPCVEVECSGLPSDLETSLFGTTGNDGGGEPHLGVETVSAASAIARARGGTLILAHLDQAPSRVQRRLATVLHDREVIIGRSGRPVDVNLRVVAVVSPDVAGDGAGGLRPELAARFQVRLEVPPLRRRREDVPMLATRCLDRCAASSGGRAVRFSRAALEVLAALPWPGNVPELEQVVEAVFAEVRRPIVQIEDVLRHVSLDGVPRVAGAQGLREARERFERECIEAALARHQGRVGEAARALGIQRTNLYRKVRQLGISKALLSSHR